MYTLADDSLSVSILDPLADRQHLWTRYCHGGYIYQVTDARHGPLLSGPQYPGPHSAFDGQGIPDAFNLSPLTERGKASSEALLIGIGRCDLGTDQVLEYADWDVQPEAHTLNFRARQSFAGYGLLLERSIHLRRRTVRSATRLANTGQAPIPVVWFPHPFYPLPPTEELCRFNIDVSMPDNPGYVVAANGWIHRAGPPGHYQPLHHHAHTPLTVLQRHPVVGLAAGTCSYAPAFFPIWGNANTFSWEPFLERTVAAGHSLEWWIDYDF
jgi:hypothetical protein